jgi:hypothetical protein
MRSLATLLLAASLLVVPCLGCGGDRPDPREREDFIDTTDPDAALQEMEEPGPGGGEPAGAPGAPESP